MTVREMVDRFVAIEKKHGLMDRSVSGYFFWSYMRFNVFQTLQRKLIPSCGEDHPDFKVKSNRRGLRQTCKDVVRRFAKAGDYSGRQRGARRNKIPACAIAGGNPAKVFASRNIEKYEQLKREGKFRKRYL